MIKGKLIGIGTGPGDPDLLTIKAHKVLSSVDVICAPRSAKNRPSIALSIVKNVLDLREDSFHVLEPVFPMKEDLDLLEKHWDTAANQVASYLDKGQDVAFVTLGDPSIYSTFSYIQRKIEDRGYLVEMVPGITSFTGCASSAGIPLVEKDDILVIVPKVDNRLKNILEDGDTFVIMKTSRHSALLEETIKADPREKEIISIKNCSMDDEEVKSGFVDHKKYLSTTLVKFYEK
ncbi:precorrin-2 C(20)-methyltransferase [Methanobacterium alkalithermotolerans]|uniref:Precorrin-2 C(20)-methyltransferase n=1 Tax=Methanobacterium alkalithermotolerans TaxID=2731220 RepID=A0A8T8K478_9EURY|nr:precorrin-2 C(20)-methyltransferase [Methanobacterium alkalithermotolerans]QUH23338.1 precorrin-2 C(20)-methyltransferase [Methanobacterium alkalithermotolerans]RJS48898.1 MAG: precorrin-2 C(20)-methyltransferase [Methanobacterium sp.]